jgi:hypothetical protein
MELYIHGCCFFQNTCFNGESGLARGGYDVLAVGDGLLRMYYTALTTPQSMSYQTSVRDAYCESAPCQVLASFTDTEFGLEWGNASRFSEQCGGLLTQLPPYTVFTPFPVSGTFSDASPLVIVTDSDGGESQSEMDFDTSLETLSVSKTEGFVMPLRSATAKVESSDSRGSGELTSDTEMPADGFWDRNGVIVVTVCVSAVVGGAVIVAVGIVLYRRWVDKMWGGCGKQLLDDLNEDYEADPET